MSETYDEMYLKLPQALQDFVEKVTYVSATTNEADLPVREKVTRAVVEWAWYIKHCATVEWEVEQFKYVQAQTKTKAENATSSDQPATHTPGAYKWAINNFPEHTKLFAEHAKMKQIKTKNAQLGGEASPSEGPSEVQR